MNPHDDCTPDATDPSQHGLTRRTVLGALGASAAMLTQTGRSATAADAQSPPLPALADMAVTPTALERAPRAP